MEYRHVHYWQYVPGKQEEEVLEAALNLSQQERHNAFLTEIATFITTQTGIRDVLIGRISDDKTSIRTLVVMDEGKLQQNYTYSLKGTPCETTMVQRFCYYPFDVAATFPEDVHLKQQRVDSYLGSLLLSEENEPIGLIVLTDEKQIHNAAFAEHLILILSPAIEAEISLLTQQ